MPHRPPAAGFPVFSAGSGWVRMFADFRESARHWSRRIPVITIAAIASAVASAQPVPSQATFGDLEAVRDREVTIGVYTDNYPYSFRGEDGRITGFVFDIVTEIEKVMNLKLRHVEGTTPGLQSAFKEGKLDLLQSLASSPEREQYAQFSTPYLVMEGEVFMRKGLPRIQRIEDLRGLRVLVHPGSIGERVLVGRGLRQSIVYVGSVEEALQWIERGNGDATLATRLTALSLVHQDNLQNVDLANVEIPEYQVMYCFAARRGEAALITRINEGIAVLRSTGRLDEIYRKWFGFTQPVGYTTQEILFAVAIGLSLALLIAVWAVIHQRKLSRRITRQAAELQKNETSFRTLLQSASDGIWISGPAGNVLEVNSAATRMFGYTREELLAMNITSVVVPTEVSQIMPRMAQLRTGANARGEWTCRRKDGSEFPVEVSATILPDGRLFGILRDVSARRAAEEALRCSEAQLSNALKIANLGHWEYDFATESFVFNDHFYDLMRTTAGREGGYRMPAKVYTARFCHPDDIAIISDEIANAAAADNSDYMSRIEHRVIFGDGKPGHVAVRIFVHNDGSGRTERAYGVNQDITQLKLADEALRSAERRFRALIEHSADGILLIDADLKIIYASPSNTAIEGHLPSELVGTNALEGIHADDLDLANAVFRQLHESPATPLPTLWRRRHKNGSWLWLEGIVTNLLEDPAVSAVVANYRDVTARRQLEDQYRQSQKMEAIGQLAGGVAHDFNNILAAIMMQVDLASSAEPLPPGTSEMLGEIKSSAKRAAKLTEQLLAFGRRQVLQTRLFNLNDAVTALAKMLQRVVGEHVSMSLILHPKPIMIRADSGMIDQVLLNLVINARDAMPSGGQLVIRTGEVNVSPSDSMFNSDLRAGWHASLSVTDTGIGIAPENLQRLFEPFFTTKEPGRGTGLGLSTVFGIARQHGGTVTVESKVSFGSTFRVLLPRIDEIAAPIVTPRPVQAPRGGSETVLLVEDDPALRGLTRKVLEKAGYRVPEAATGSDALRVWREMDGKIDLLFTDIVMPDGLNGWELATRLQSTKPSLKVIFTSGHSEDVAGRQLELNSGQAFIQKPSPPATLLETVRRSLDS